MLQNTQRLTSLSRLRLIMRLVHSSAKKSSPNTTSFKSNTQSASSSSANSLIFNRNSNSDTNRLYRSVTDFPTPFDLTSQQNANKHTSKIWALLDACLKHGEFKRAKALLDSLYDITDLYNQKSVESFLDSLNKYLLVWSSSKDVSLDEVEKFAEGIKIYYNRVAADSKTVAILIKVSMEKPKFSDKPVDSEENATYYKTYINAWMQNDKPINEVLSNIDVLPISYLKRIHDECYIALNEFPTDIKVLLSESSFFDDGQLPGSHNKGETRNKGKIDANAVEEVLSKMKSTTHEEEDELDWTENIPGALKKLGYDELKAVDSFGLKVIRHSLLALAHKSNDEFVDKFLGKLEDPEKYVNLDKQSINFFKIYSSLESQEDKDLFNNLLEDFNKERERQLEAKSIEGAEQNWKHNAEEATKHGGLLVKDKKLNILLWKWFQDMLPLVENDIQTCASIVSGNMEKQPSKTKSIRIKRLEEVAPFFTLVNARKMVVITILEILKLTSTGGVVDGMKTARAVVSVGNAIEKEYQSDVLLKTEEKAFQGLNKNEKNKKLRNILERSKARFRHDEMKKEIIWQYDTRAKIGSILVSNFIKVAKIDVMGVDPKTGREISADVPAIIHTYQYSNGVKLGVLKLHSELLNQLGTQNLKFSIFPQSYPMLTKPREWSSWNNGGYEFSRNAVIRTKDSPEQLAYIKIASKRSDLDNVFDGLNVLGKTAWTINERVLKILTNIWNSCEDFLAIPKNVSKPDIPPPPPRESEPTVKRDWQRHAKKIANEYGAQRSLRCDTNYKLEIARAFVGEKFYFPHNMDFRGRTYPLSPHFNHLGNDLSRGLLIFWEGTKLGPNGLFWLKVHLANLFGHSKLPFDQRVEFVDKNMAAIRESVENPYDKSGLWLTAEDPWQALAVMLELTDALKLPDPSEFISHQPVHQDGTCNGLQHYAALGGDIEGATQVNLHPSDRPQDVYNYVAQLTKKTLEKEAAQGSELAEKLVKVINRKIIKQTVMTNVYGVTYVGATAQIRKQLDHYFEDKDECYQLSIFLTRRVFHAIRTLFTGAHLIQDWLSECAKRITKSVNIIDFEEDQLHTNTGKPRNMSSVIWTTPLGLPVVQPYRITNKRQISTNLQTVFISDPFELNEVYSQRQVTAFPPNYIHSLDATHMLLSASECYKNGISFASVHDSYWTHASSIDKMNVVLREAFIKLHSNNLIGRVKTEFEDRYKNNLLIISVPKNDRITQKILKFRAEYSDKAGKSLNLREEIRLERKRMKGETSEENSKTSVSILSSDDIEHLFEVSKDFGANSKKTEFNLDDELKKNVEINLDTYEDSANNKRSASDHIKILVPFQCSDIPKRGDFDVNTIKSSKYFFS